MSRRAFTVLAGAFVATACFGKDPTNPGVEVGTFHVKASLTASTCGQPPNPWEFDVRINRDGSTLYWIQGQAPVAGEVDRTARTKLDTTVTSQIRPANTAKKLAACEIMRKDTLDVLLATADQKPAVDPADVNTFAGQLRYEFAPTDGSQCDDQLTASGGGYDALPCLVQYDLTGALTKKPD
ncbi:MAG: hypothetical protein U0270_35305 [Labilithrix sp.]